MKKNSIQPWRVASPSALCPGGWFKDSIAPLGANRKTGPKPGAALADSFAPG